MWCGGHSWSPTFGSTRACEPPTENDLTNSLSASSRASFDTTCQMPTDTPTPQANTATSTAAGILTAPMRRSQSSETETYFRQGGLPPRIDGYTTLGAAACSVGRLRPPQPCTMSPCTCGERAVGPRFVNWVIAPAQDGVAVAYQAAFLTLPSRARLHAGRRAPPDSGRRRACSLSHAGCSQVWPVAWAAWF